MTGYASATDQYEEVLLKKGNISIMYDYSDVSGDEKSSHSKTKISAFGGNNKFDQSQSPINSNSNNSNVNMTTLRAPNPAAAVFSFNKSAPKSMVGNNSFNSSSMKSKNASRKMSSEEQDSKEK